MTKWNTKTAKNAPADAQSDAREPYALGEWRQTLELKRPKENRYDPNTPWDCHMLTLGWFQGSMGRHIWRSHRVSGLLMANGNLKLYCMLGMLHAFLAHSLMMGLEPTRESPVD